ncbi:MAG: preprotein translocase subunit SecA [Pseudomonadota bacterium]
MVTQLFRKVIGSRNERILKRYGKVVKQINGLEPTMQAKSDEELCAQTEALRARFAGGATLDELIPEAFATVREAGVRALEMRHFDVQLMGAMAMHDGKIAEMRTGEGKTLVATLAAYLNALTGEGVHIVTVNDYLARRDAEWMGKLYNFLGMTVGVVVPGLAPEDKRAAYAADITYGTNNEYGFDYLRDNMAFSAEEKMQRALAFAIVDEVDSILIDEARTPLIISGPAEESSQLYVAINRLIPLLTKQEEEDGPGDFSVDEKAKQVYLTEEGHQNVEVLLSQNELLGEGDSLYDAANIALMHHFNAALRAHALFKRDVDYIVKNDEVVIVDEFTGRTMEGRRWSDGLHQAVEAKEGVTIQQENQTLASITFQNYFRMYDKLSGMTGTADTEAAEFQQIYGLEVMLIPTHLDMVRDDRSDLVFLSQEEKFEAILEEIRDCRDRGQPTLVGTASIDTSEMLSTMLKKEGITHEVLNAKQHAREAAIIAQAGRPGAVTIATNMAGRGTDIVLGGNWQVEAEEGDEADETSHDRLRDDWETRHGAVLDSGGLHIIGTERHESRRVDNQLRGRAGRQGDPGSSRFFLSLEDDLMRIFASERVKGLMERLGMERGEAIEHKWVSKAIENAQRKVEGRNFDIRKQLLEYDDVANDQRKEIYGLRNELMSTEDVSDMVDAIREDSVSTLIDTHIPPESLDELWDVPGLERSLENEFGVSLEVGKWLEDEDELYEEPLRERIHDAVKQAYDEKVELATPDIMRAVEKAVMLQVLDSNWKEHLAAMDYLRQGIHLRGYAQKNPKQEYKREAFEMFNMLLDRYKSEVVTILTKGQIRAEAQPAPNAPTTIQMQHEEAPAMAGAELAMAEEAAAPVGGPAPAGPAPATPFVRSDRKIGRNEPCPCGSGKKYKNCHGRLQ